MPRFRWVVVLVLVGFAVVGGHAAGSVEYDAGESRAAVQSAQSGASNNTTVRHRDPRTLREAGDLEAVSRWVARELGGILIDCTAGIAVADTAVCDRLNAEYPKWLAVFIDVAGETDAEADDTAAGGFADAGDQLREFRSGVAGFRETYAAYRDARARGEQARARSLARDLIDTAEEVNATGSNLTRSYRTLHTHTDRDFTGSIEDVERVTENLTATADRIKAEVFIATTVTAQAESDRISFREPLIVTGSLSTVNGTRLPNQSIDLRAGGQRVGTTTTNASGRFRLRYRPITLPVTTHQVTVAFAPGPDSEYRYSETLVPIVVEPVQPTISVGTQPRVVRYGDALRIHGTVHVNGTPVPQVPMVLHFWGDHVGTVRTNATGAYAETRAIPAGLSAGEHEVRAAVGLQDRAIADAIAHHVVIVQSTATSVSITGNQTGDRAIAVTARLLTATDRPVPGQPVTIAVNGTPVQTVTTNGDGAFTTAITLSRPMVPDGNTTFNVSVSFAGHLTNLNPSTAHTTIRFTVIDTTSDNGGSLAAFVIAAVGAVLAALWFGRRWLPTDRIQSVAERLPVIHQLLGGLDTGSDASGGVAPVVDEGGADLREGQPIDRLAGAMAYLQQGEVDRAIETAYVITRAHLRRDISDDVGLTHWEFLAACRANGLDPDAVTALEALTESYERAVFASRPAPRETGERALDASRAVLGSRPG